MTFILMWLALTTPPQVCLTVVSKENPAGQAIAAQVERMNVPEAKKLLFCRACGATEWDSQENRHHTIDVATRDPTSKLRVKDAKVLVVTTGTAFKAVDHWHPEIAEHIGASCMLVHEEGQQAPELLSVSAVAMTRVPCLVIFVGDGNQSPGGIKDSKLSPTSQAGAHAATNWTESWTKEPYTSQSQRGPHKSDSTLAGT